LKKYKLENKIITSIIEADVDEKKVKEFIEKWSAYKLRAIAVDLTYLTFAKKLLRDTDIRLTAVASYPLGGMTTESKINQLKYAIKMGADEIDVSLNYNAIKSGDFDRISEEVRQIAKAAEGKIDVIMIPMTYILTNKNKIEICKIILENGVKSIKTNSGFGAKTVFEDVSLIKRMFHDDLRIEVAGGVRTARQAEEYLKLGADYIHTSTPEKVLEGVE